MMLLTAFAAVVLCTIVQGEQTPPRITEFKPSGSDKLNLDDPNDLTRKDALQLVCKANGSVPMTFVWKKNGLTISTVGGTYSVKNVNEREQILINSYPNPTTDGKYQCFVNNAAGRTFTRKLRVKFTFTNDFAKSPTVVEESIATIGRSLRLKCPPKEKKGSGATDFGATYFWARKTKEMVNLSPNDHRVGLPNGDFLFLYLAKSDVDEIKKFDDKAVQCIVTAGNSIYYSHMFKLKVTKTETTDFAPKFESTDDYPKSQEQAISGKSKDMFCAAVGKPAPKITWYRLEDDKKTVKKKIVDGEEGINLKDSGRRLSIEVASKTQHEGGYYQCEASNGIGTAIKTSPTKLEVVVPPKWMKTPTSEFNVPIEGSDTLLLGALGTPPPTYKWYYNGTAFTSDKELGPNIIVDGKKLKFSNMQQANEGVFQCAVENNWGMLVSWTYVKVKANKPNIIKFGPFYLFKGTNATLKCESNGAPRAEHLWSLNGKKLIIQGRYSTDKQGSLIIQNVQYSDEGKYKCFAENSIGTDEAESQATVYEKTTIFRRPQENVFIELNKPLDLQCEATADKRLFKFLTYKWLKDNSPIKYQAKRVMWLSGMNVLRITDAIITDGANYTCIAYTDTKQRSSDSASSIADVKGVPFPPYDLTITNCKEGNTTITWKKGKDNDFPTTKFIIEQESTYFPEQWQVIANNIDPTKLKHSTKLTAWADLTFRMRAVNKIGPSRASAPTPKGKCITDPSGPTMYPQNLRGIPGKAGELDIAWTPMTKLQANGLGLHYLLYVAVANNKTVFGLPIRIESEIGRYKVPNPGTYMRWKFKIAAKNNILRGPTSNVVKSFSGQNAPTGKPMNIKILKVNARSIELSWTRVDIDPLPGSVDGYKIYYWGESKSVESRRKRRAIPPGASIFTASHTTADTQKVEVTGLKPYSTYTMALKAFNSGGEGPTSDEFEFDTLQDVPGPVANFKAYPFSSYIFTSWGKPTEKNGILTGYTIAVVKHSDKEPHKPPPTSGFVDMPINKFEHLFKNMEPETRYVVYLRALTVIGPGPVLKADLKTIAPSKPARPRAPTVNAKTTTSVNVTFLFGESPGGYPLEFMVKYRETASNESFKETGWFDHLEKRWAIVDGLAIDRLHDFVTVGRNKLGNSKDSPITKARPLPAVGAGKRVSTPFYKTPWFIILMVLIIILLILLLIAILFTRKRGAKYPVGKREKERAGILDPNDEEDMIDMGRVDDNPPPYPSQGSLEKHNMSDDDRDSLDDYGEGPQFKEDGSFIEEYGDDRKKLSDDKDKSATATFV